MPNERDYQMQGTVTALSSISHIGESRGTVAEFRAEKIVGPNGTVEEIPIFSGNGIRGQLRDTGMRHMLEQLGYGQGADGLSLPAFHFLFSGGALSSKGGRALDVGFARRLMDTIPLAAVFGGAVGNQIIQGKLLVGKLIPIAAETRHLIPGDVLEQAGAAANLSVWDYVQQEHYTRRDDAKSEHLRPLLSQTERLMIEDAEAHAAEKREAGEKDVAEETGEKQQMRYTVMTLAAGTPFYWRLIARRATDVQFEALITTLLEFSRHPHIGGKSAVGHGDVRIEFTEWLTIDPGKPIEGERVEIGKSFGAAYADHLRNHADDIRSLLEEVA